MKTLLKISKVITYFASFLAFVLLFIYPEYWLILGIISSLFLAFITCFVHEMGHAIYCIITKKEIASVIVMDFYYNQGKVGILDGVSFVGKVIYKDPTKDKLVYLFGLLASLVFFLINLVVFIFNQQTYLIPFILSSLFLVIIYFPLKNTDIVKLFKR